MIGWMKVLTGFSFYLLSRILLLFLPTPPSPRKQLLVLKLASLGDYFLFRNFLQALSESDRYRDHTITLCANSKLRHVVETLDHRWVHEFIPVSYPEILYHLPHFLKTMRRLRGRYNIVVQPVYSREFIPDILARFAGTGDRVTFRGDTNNMSRLCKAFSDRWFTRLIGDEGLPVFELYRNRFFFEALSEGKMEITRPVIADPGQFLPARISFPERFAILFPGALQPFRRWPEERFAALADHLHHAHELAVFIAGGPGDRPLADKIMQACQHQVTDLTGQLTLPELAGVLSKATLLVSNDTLAVHVAASAGTPVVVISQMNYYGRFVPYPVESGVRMLCVIPEIFRGHDPGSLIQRFRNGSVTDIATVDFNSVREACDSMLKDLSSTQEMNPA